MVFSYYCFDKNHIIGCSLFLLAHSCVYNMLYLQVIRKEFKQKHRKEIDVYRNTLIQQSFITFNDQTSQQHRTLIQKVVNGTFKVFTWLPRKTFGFSVATINKRIMPWVRWSMSFLSEYSKFQMYSCTTLEQLNAYEAKFTNSDFVPSSWESMILSPKLHVTIIGLKYLFNHNKRFHEKVIIYSDKAQDALKAKSNNVQLKANELLQKTTDKVNNFIGKYV